MANRLTRQAFEEGVTRGLSQLNTSRDRILILEQERDLLISDLDDAVEQHQLCQAELTSARETWQLEVREERRRVDAARAELAAVREKYDTYEHFTGERVDELQKALHAAQIGIARKDVLLEKVRAKLLATSARIEPSTQE